MRMSFNLIDNQNMAHASMDSISGDEFRMS